MEHRWNDEKIEMIQIITGVYNKFISKISLENVCMEWKLTNGESKRHPMYKKLSHTLGKYLEP